MRIGFLTAGAGDMLCGSCIRDTTLAQALTRNGQEVIFCPLYTPISTDDEGVVPSKQFYSGVSAYLQQRHPLFRRIPPLFDAPFESRTILKALMKLGADDRKMLAEMTKSVLLGSEGNQSKELRKLVAWFRDRDAQVFNLPNTLLSGLARDLRSELKAPVLSTLQGEDLFVDAFEQDDRTEIIGLMRRRAEDLDGFISVSHYYADFMSEYLRIPKNKIHVVHNGINLHGFGAPEKGNVVKRSDGFVVGYMARVCRAKGLHILVEALKLLRDWGHDVGVRAAGWLSREDEGYLAEIRSNVRKLGLERNFEYLGVVSREDKINILRTCDVVSVPTEYREPFGLYVLEALAAGTPVVLPEHGAFPELIRETGGGMLHKPLSAEDLAGKIAHLIEHPDGRKRLAETGRTRVFERFSSDVMAEGVIEVYGKYV